jgi:hypothetical protein
MTGRERDKELDEFLEEEAAADAAAGREHWKEALRDELREEIMKEFQPPEDFDWSDAFDAANQYERSVREQVMIELGLGRPRKTEKHRAMVEAVRRAIAAGARKPDAISLAAREFKQSKDWVRKLVRAADKKNKT